MLQYTRSAENQFKKEETTVGWSWRLFVFSILAFCTALFIYLGIDLGYEKYLNEEINKLIEEDKQLDAAISPEAQRKIELFYSQIYNIQNVLKGHINPTKLMAFLEANATAKVSFEKLTYNSDTGSLTIDAKAPTYSEVTAQLEAFRRREEITDLVLSNSKNEILNEQVTGPVSFTMRLVFSKEYLLTQ